MQVYCSTINCSSKHELSSVLLGQSNGQCHYGIRDTRKQIAFIFFLKFVCLVTTLPSAATPLTPHTHTALQMQIVNANCNRCLNNRYYIPVNMTHHVSYSLYIHKWIYYIQYISTCRPYYRTIAGIIRSSITTETHHLLDTWAWTYTNCLLLTMSCVVLPCSVHRKLSSL